MLPPAGSEARWREEVMPGRAYGEVMLALTHQEAKTKEKEQGIICKFQVASCELQVKKPNETGLERSKQNGYPFAGRAVKY